MKKILSISLIALAQFSSTYSNYTYVEQNLYVKAQTEATRAHQLALLKRAAEGNHPQAQFALAEHHKGQGHINEALGLYALSADAGYAPAQFALAEHYKAQGHINEALRLYALSADAGYAPAQFALAEHYKAQGHINEALRLYALSADAGYAPAQFALAEHCKNAQSIKLCLSAAEQGYAPAQFFLGQYYEDFAKKQKPNDAVASYEKAFDFYRNAAMNGSADALEKIKLIAYPSDNETAAAKGFYSENIAARFALAQIYEIKKEFIMAIEQYRVLATAGHLEAQYKLGLFYQNGLGTAKDLENGALWLKLAADKGHAKAQYELGECYYYGRGVDQSTLKAREWHTKAAAQRHLKSKEWLESSCIIF